MIAHKTNPNAAVTLVSLLLALAACNSTSHEQDVSTDTLQPGETTVDIGNMHYSINADTSEATGVIDMCSIVYNADSVAIVKINHYDFVPVKDDCSGPYSDAAYILNVDVLGLVYGPSISYNKDIVIFPDRQHYVSNTKGYDSGNTLVVGLRDSGDQSFVTRALRVDFSEEHPGLDPSSNSLSRYVELPHGFDDFIESAVEYKSSFDENCSYLGWTDDMSNDVWHTVTHDPGHFGCVSSSDVADECSQEDDCME